MIRRIFSGFAQTLLVFMVCTTVQAEEKPSESLIACLNGNGQLYNVRPKNTPGEACSGSDIQVQLGPSDITRVTPGEGLVGGGISGDITIGIDPKFALPPSCPPGQVPVSDDEGGWICTPRGALARQNGAASVWVIPILGPYGRIETDERLILPGNDHSATTIGTNVHAVNTSNKDGEVTFLPFTRDGRLQLDWVITRPVPRGGRTFYRATSGMSEGWMAVIADVSLMVSARESDFGTAFGGFASAHRSMAYPVDCRFPNGYEFVCQFAGVD